MRVRSELDIPLTLSEIADATHARLSCTDERVIRAVTTDSRSSGVGDLFIPIDRGYDFIPDAYLRGASTVGDDGCDIVVSDTRRALLDLALYYRRRLRSLKHVIGITGSVGKTTVKDFTAAILSRKYKVHKTAGNLNNGIGLPFTVLSAPKDTEILVLEMGMNHKGEISELSRVANPDIGVITNIGTAHIGNLGSRRDIALAKLEITEGMSKNGLLILPMGEPLLNTDKFRTRYFGRDGECEAIRTQSATAIILFGKSLIPTPRFFAEHLATNISCAALIAYSLGMSAREIAAALSDEEMYKTRSALFDLGRFRVLDDSYNASLESYMAAFDMLSGFDAKYRSAVIGDIFETGAHSEDIHRRLGGICAKHGLDFIYPFGPNAPFVLEGATACGFDQKNIFINEDLAHPEITALEIIKRSRKDELILVKGSHAVQAQRITEYLKDHKGD